jgi:hypothetical protein
MVPSVFIWMLLFLGCEEEVEEPEVTPPAVVNTTGDANVTSVYAREDADGTWTFHVSVTHKDVNWYDYADGWDVLLPDGTVVKPDHFSLYTHHLRHPHVEEQPFTRTQKAIVIPEGVDTVIIRAHDKRDGWGGEEIAVDLNVRFGNKFSVKRRL